MTGSTGRSAIRRGERRRLARRDERVHDHGRALPEEDGRVRAVALDERLAAVREDGYGIGEAILHERSGPGAHGSPTSRSLETDAIRPKSRSSVKRRASARIA